MILHRCRDCSVPPWTEAHGVEDYMVKPEVWAAAGMPAHDPRKGEGASGFLCVGCIEQRLGRTLRAVDFIEAPINVVGGKSWHGPRLRRRLLAKRSRKLAAA